MPAKTKSTTSLTNITLIHRTTIQPSQSHNQRQPVEMKSTPTNLQTVIEAMTKRFKTFKIQEMLLLMTMDLLTNIELTGPRRNLRMNGEIMKAFNLDQI